MNLNFEETITKVLTKIRNGHNLFITGGAGSGKSYLLKALKMRLQKQITLTASTGVAAINIGGITIHSFAKLGIGMDSFEKIVSKINKDKKAKQRIVNCKILAIDEISMLSAKFLNLLNKVFKTIRGSDSPFGGTTVLLFGDFLQLPPVIREEEDGLCLNCSSWREAEFETIFLNKNYRQQEDVEFYEILKSIRLGRDLDFAFAKLQTRVGMVPEKKSIVLVSHKLQANEINLKNLTSLNTEGKSFVAKIEGKEECVKTYLPFFEENTNLQFKRGARVMLNFNLKVEEGLCNGAIGNIIEFSKEGFPVVLFDCLPYPVIIQPNSFVIEDQFTSEVLFNFIQIPLQLAYSVTIHKSQGLTFESVSTDISKCFAQGQAYVSLSRSKTLNGLFLERFNKNVFKTNPQIVEFYESLE